MTAKERIQLEFVQTQLNAAQSFLLSSKDRSWGMALEQMADASEELRELLAAKQKKEKTHG